MPPWLGIALLWAGFAGAHLYLSGDDVRPRLVARLGPDVFRGVYSLVVLVWFGWLVWYWWHHKHTGPLLWTTLGPPVLARALNHVLMFAAFVLLVPAVLPASAAPSLTIAGGRDASVVRGLLRITRHPLLMALALFGLAHLLVNGTLGDVAFFAGFPLFVWIGTRHQDARLARDRPGYGELIAQTSVVPFGAILGGRQRLVVSELPWGSMAAGLVLGIVVRQWHGFLFGP